MNLVRIWASGLYQRSGSNAGLTKFPPFFLRHRRSLERCLPADHVEPEQRPARRPLQGSRRLLFLERRLLESDLSAVRGLDALRDEVKGRVALARGVSRRSGGRCRGAALYSSTVCTFMFF